MTEEYIEDYEGELSLEDAGYVDEAEDEEDPFEAEYEQIFDPVDEEVDEDVDKSFDRDAITGRPAKRARMAVLNKSNVSKQELDELFLG